MSLTEDLPWTCRCGVANVARARVSWPLRGEPEDAAALASILDDSFHVFHCTACGYRAVVDRNLLVIHHVQAWAIYAVHDAATRASVGPQLVSGFPGYRTRVVVDRTGLVERARLLVSGVDDVAVEIARFYHGLSLGLVVDPHTRLVVDRIDARGVVFAVVHRGAKTSELETSHAELAALSTRHDTARYVAGPQIDEGFVRWLLDPGRRR